ncbi:hypothetical protein [Thalassotalea insulae]|nr:hypothetical protein [Thalassotalea insulae]
MQAFVVLMPLVIAGTSYLLWGIYQALRTSVAAINQAAERLGNGTKCCH